MPLRDYQVAAVNSIFDQWNTVRSTLLVLATGLGKSVCIAEVINRAQPKRVLVLAHREELIYQLCTTIQEWAGLECAIEMAFVTADVDLFKRKQVVVSTIQTQISGGKVKRYNKFKPSEFDLIVIDEAHHGTAKGYRDAILHYFQNPNTKMLCVTATPDRHDGVGLGAICDTVAYNMGIYEGIRSGWLVDVAQQLKKVKGLDYSHIHTNNKGDLNQAELEKLMEMESNIAGIVHPSLESIYGLAPELLTCPTENLSELPVKQWRDYLMASGRTPRRTIVFAASVSQAETLCNIFNRVMPEIAEWVYAKTDKDDRKEILQRFKTGKTAIVVNVGILLEGYDNPGVEVIIMARATKSRALYTQCIGRATRPLPGLIDHLDTPEDRCAAIKGSKKPHCLIVDFVGNSGRHKLITSFEVLSGNLPTEAIELAKKNALEAKNPKLASAAVRNAEKEIAEEKRRKEQQEAIAKKALLVPKVSWSTRDINPFAANETTSWMPRRGEDFEEPTEKQKGYLGFLGVYPIGPSKKQASWIIGIAKAHDNELPEEYSWLKKKWRPNA